ncbi:MAG: tetratricopeptide repeat protein [Phocaeicola sp.]
MKSINIFLVAACVSLPMHAQETTVEVKQTNLQVQADQTIQLSLDVNIPPEMHISSNEVLILTPYLQAADTSQSVAFHSMYIYGRNRQIIMKRSRSFPNENTFTLRRKNKELQTASYLSRTPYEKWMLNGELQLLVELAGCANCAETYEQSILENWAPERYEIRPAIAYTIPEPEPIKVREENGKAFLDFPVNQTVIHPTYRKNPAELAAIHQTIDRVKERTDLKITEIVITGHASPEGSYSNNSRLAIGRAESLKRYIIEKYNLPTHEIKAQAVPEDWEGLRNYVTQSESLNIPEILEVIDHPVWDYDTKDNQLKKIKGGKVYAELLNECYPALRRSDYVVEYIVPSFNTEETKKAMHERPKHVSQEELFQVAKSYEQGTEQFNESLQTAVQLFPIDPTANANAGAIELQRGNWQEAMRYLEKADPNRGETINNLGVLKLMQGNWVEAETLLKEAESKGVKEATINLQELENKRKDLAIYGDE